ncbi:MAG: hypothetical protein ACK5Q5_23765 [Planctomycetaceae bacterium]
MPGPLQFHFLVFPFAHVAVGLGLIYAILTGHFNRTTARVQNGLLQIQHGPIWYPGGRTIPVDDIAQLYCSAGVSMGKHSRCSLRSTRHAQLQSVRSIPLLKESANIGIVAAVVQLLEQHLYRTRSMLMRLASRGLNVRIISLAAAGSIKNLLISCDFPCVRAAGWQSDAPQLEQGDRPDE